MQYVTFLLNSVWHAILENFRPCAVWLVDLALFYVLTEGRFGEAWTAWSWMELAGMGMLLLGSLVYNGTVRGRQTAATMHTSVSFLVHALTAPFHPDVLCLCPHRFASPPSSSIRQVKPLDNATRSSRHSRRRPCTLG
jgi:hypothetical protein